MKKFVMMLAVDGETKEEAISRMWEITAKFSSNPEDYKYPDYVWSMNRDYDLMLEVKEIELPDVPELLDQNPTWSNFRVHNWMNYVPEQYKKTWRHHTLETRLAIYEMAESQASKEEWP